MRILLVTAALLGLLCVPSTAAAEGWLPFKFASPAKVEATDTHVGVDAAGNVTVVWRNDTDIKNAFGTLTISSALLPAGTSAYQGPLPVTTNSGSGSPRIGVAASGAAVVVWERPSSGKDVIEGTTRSLGVWGSATELTDAGDQTADYLTMDLAPNGEGIVGWRVEGSPRKNKVRMIAGGNFAPAPGKAFDTSPYPGNNEPDVAVAADGSAAYLIGHKYDVGNTRLNLYSHSPLGWDTGVEVASTSQVPQVAVAPNGEPVLAWLESNVLKVKRGSSPTATVANIGGLSLLDLAVGPPTEEFPNGMVLVTWRQLVDDGSMTSCCYQARAAVGSGFSMGPPIELSDELEDVANNPAVQAAVGPDGTAYAAWSRFGGDTWVPQASARPPGGAFPGVADDLGDGDASVRDIVTAADGRAIVAIDEADSEGSEVYFRAATATYVPPPAPPKGSGAAPLPGPPPADKTPPKVKVNLSRKSFAPGDKLNQVAVKNGDTSFVKKAVRGPLKEGTRLLVSLDEPARLAIRIDKIGCYTASPANPARKETGACLKSDPNVQHLSTNGKAGLNKLTYLGNWGGGKVKPGALYEFEVVATDAAGNRSVTARTRFTLDGKPSANGF